MWVMRAPEAMGPGRLPRAANGPAHRVRTPPTIRVKAPLKPSAREPVHLGGMPSVDGRFPTPGWRSVRSDPAQSPGAASTAQEFGPALAAMDDGHWSRARADAAGARRT